MSQIKYLIEERNPWLVHPWNQSIEWVYGDLTEENRRIWLNSSLYYHEFHGYRIYFNGLILSKRGDKPKATYLRERRGGGHDVVINLHYAKKPHKWTVSRLVGTCFLGPVHGYEMNHKDRNPMNNNLWNLERTTASENQQHWRAASSNLRKASSSKDKDLF